MVVMTKGRPYQQQSYKVSAHFPCEWVRRKNSDGFMVTCCATIGSRDNYYWVVVVTAGAGFETQAVELDFVYPSEAIHHYWDRGEQILSSWQADKQRQVQCKHRLCGQVQAFQISKQIGHCWCLHACALRYKEIVKSS